MDFSTGSVGLGAAAPLFAAVTRRYVDNHFGARPSSRFVALIGDAELDEGNVWEAIADPACRGLGNVMWVVDFNRQSLDRVVPGIKVRQLQQMFEAANWHVVEVKYGRRLDAAFGNRGGDVLRRWIDEIPNEQYQSFFKFAGAELRKRFCDGAPAGVEQALAPIPDDELAETVQDLGGHDLAAMLDSYRQCDEVTDRPSAHVVEVTSLDRLFATRRRGLQADLREARAPGASYAVLRRLFPERAPIVTAHVAASHTMAWLGSALGVPCVPLGVDAFGQTGRVRDLYELHDLAPGHIVNAALAALSLV